MDYLGYSAVAQPWRGVSASQQANIYLHIGVNLCRDSYLSYSLVTYGYFFFVAAKRAETSQDLLKNKCHHILLQCRMFICM